jgi:hypothetical protein
MDKVLNKDYEHNSFSWSGSSKGVHICTQMYEYVYSIQTDRRYSKKKKKKKKKQKQKQNKKKTVFHIQGGQNL